MRKLVLGIMCLIVILLAGCGGGGVITPSEQTQSTLPGVNPVIQTPVETPVVQDTATEVPQVTNPVVETPVEVADNTTTPEEVADNEGPVEKGGPITRARVIEIAKSWLGVPYWLGGDSRSGIDCSAFVSRCLDIPRQTTETIVKYCYKIRKEDLLPGDILNWRNASNPTYGHVRIFYCFANAQKTRIWVYEAAGDRGVVFREIPYEDKYTPLRYGNITTIDAGSGSKYRNRFEDCFRRNGSSPNVGVAKTATYWRTGYVMQDFMANTPTGTSIIVHDEYRANSTSNVPAVWIHGVIGDKYLQYIPQLGAPIQEECAGLVSRPTGVKNIYLKTRYGTVVYHTTGSRTGQAFAVYGKICDKWASMGYGQSSIGLPIGSVYTSGTTTRCSFERGEIYYSGSNPPSVR